MIKIQVHAIYLYIMKICLKYGVNKEENMITPITYYKKNKKRGFTLIAIILIAVFCIYFVTSLVQSVYDTSKEMSTSPFKCFSLAKKSYRSENILESELNNIAEIETMYNIITIPTTIKTIFGTTSAYIIFPENSNKLNQIFNKCKLSLTAGSFPVDDQNEIMLHESILKNKNLKIGDKLSDFSIVGTFTGDTNIILGMISESTQIALSLKSDTYLLFPMDDKLKEMNYDLSSLSKDRWEVLTYSSAIKALDEDFETLDFVMVIVIVMVAICLSISVASFVYTLYSSRYDEFAILNAVGYSKKKIKFILLNETLIIAIVSWILGFLLSIAVLLVANEAIYKEMGQTMQILSANGLVYTLLVPIMVFICSVVPTIRKLSKTDLVTIIERR